MPNPEIEDVVLVEGYAALEHIHEEPSHALFAAWQNSAIDQRNMDQDRALQRQLLQKSTENACAANRDEYPREQIKRTSEILEYFWFGDNSTPLPPGLQRLLVDERDAPVLALNSHLLDFRSFNTASRLLCDYGLDGLIRHRQKLYEKQSGVTFEPLARSLVANTPGYRLLESFNVIEHVWEDRPLTPTERVIEEQMAERNVRRRYGIDDHEPLFAHPGAQYELHRAIHRLSEATRYDRHEQPQVPPRERAYDFFSQLIIDDGDVAGEYLEGVETVDVDLPSGRKCQMLDITTDATSFRTDGETIATFAESQGFLNIPSMSRVRAMSTAIVNDMVLHLFSKNDEQERDYSEVLMELLDRHTADLVGDLEGLAVGRFSRFRFNALITLLTAPTEADEEVYGLIFLAPVIPDIARSDRMVSRKEYRQLQRNTFGYVQKRPYEDSDTRILQYRSLDMSLGDLNEATADMVLHLPKLGETLMPYIFGYETISHDAERQLFGLRYIPEADPHTQCLTVIPEASRQSLATLYADMGLNDLAWHVRDTSNLTVDQLVRFIAKTNQYSLPAQATTFEIPGTLAGFEGLIKDGKLNMQCIGSSHFLRLSLEAAFGEGTAGTIGGDTIPANGSRITDVGHQQITFIDPGTRRLYILDATSSGFHLALWRGMLSEQMGALRRNLGAGALKSLGNQRTAPTIPDEVSTVATPERTQHVDMPPSGGELIRQIKDALILQLRMVYSQDGQPISRSHLFEAVARLPEDDIVFRSLSAAILAAEDKLERRAIEQLVQYINELRTCNDPALLRKVDPQGYATQPHLLSVLQAHAGQIAKLIDK